MKVNLVFYDILENKKSFSIPLATLSASLKKEGYEVGLITVREEEKITKSTFLKILTKADIFAFSALSGSFPKVKEIIKWIKEKYPESLVVVGGPHALLNPEDVISSDGVDAVCIGEGEYCLTELSKKVKNKKPIYDTKNFWFKKNKKIIKNKRLPLIEDLDELPFIDRELFDYKEITDYKDAKQIVIMASRGCPYNCSYCANHKIRTLYPNKEKWLRFRKVDNVLKEIKQIQKKYGKHDLIKFVDDTIVQNRGWFEEFSEKYPKEIGLPILCQLRPNEADEDVMRKLKKLGVKRLEMGLESGSEFIRQKIMNRYISNKQIINAFRLARKYKINTTSFNILGLPFETLSMMLETVKINSLSHPSWAKPLYFQPFPNTEISELCKKYGFLKEGDKIKATLFEGTALESPYVTKEQVEFMYKCFRPLIKIYRIRILWPLFDATIKSKLFPFNLFIKFSPLLNLNDTISGRFPRFKKSLKKLLFWKK